MCNRVMTSLEAVQLVATSLTNATKKSQVLSTYPGQKSHTKMAQV